jgi:hypothetical protein
MGQPMSRKSLRYIKDNMSSAGLSVTPDTACCTGNSILRPIIK